MPVKAHGPLRRPLRAECLDVQAVPGNEVSLSSLPWGFGEAGGKLLSPCTRNWRRLQRLSQGHLKGLERRPAARVTGYRTDASATEPSVKGGSGDCPRRHSRNSAGHTILLGGQEDA